MDPVTLQPDVLDGPRVETYWVELLDRADNRISIIPTVLDGQVEQNWDAPIKGGCSISLHDPDIDVMKERIRPWVSANGVTWPLGVYLPTSPEESFDASGQKKWTFNCLDKLSVLDEDKMPTAWGYDTSYWVIDAVNTLIRSTGEARIAITENDAMLRTPMAWKAGTSKLVIVNDLLNTIGYSPLWVDGLGQYRVEPWVDGDRKAPVRRFEKGQYAIHGQAWSRGQNITEVPNRVIVRTDGTDEVDGLEAVADNTDPNSRYSYQARGNRWVAQVYDETEAVSQEVLEELAHRRLWGWTHPPSHYRVTHAAVPYNLLDVVQFVSDGYDITAQVNEYQVPLSVGGQVSALWNGIGGM